MSEHSQGFLVLFPLKETKYRNLHEFKPKKKKKKKHRISYVRVSISCNHVSHISGVGQLPAKYILNDNHSFASIHGGFGEISLDVLHLNFMPQPSILYSMANVTWTRISFVSHWRYSGRATGREQALYSEWCKAKAYKQ